MGIERTRFFRWRRNQQTPHDRTAADDHLAERIIEIRTYSAGVYVAARITIALRRQGLVVNRRRIARIMRERGIQGVTRRRRRSPTRPDSEAPPASNLLQRDVTALKPGTRLVGDVTCLPTSEGWLYLAVFMDLCTRLIVR
jgi:putative transposase